MKFKRYLESERIYFRNLQDSDIDKGYFEWLNDPEVSQYLETRYSIQTREMIKEFISNQSGNKNSHLFAICLKDNDLHIGNIKLGPIEFIHGRGDLSYLIGRKELWGKGYASEAVKLILGFAKKVLNLYKVDASVYEDNIGSYRVLLNNGFKKQGKLKNHWNINGKYQDNILLTKIL